MRKLFLAALAAAIIAGPAAAVELNVTDVPYQKFGPNGTAAQIIHVLPPTGAAEIAASNERAAKWISYCNPQIRVDEFGVGRYHYTKSGCEFGKSAD